MSRRSPGAESETDIRSARDRLSASLRRAGDPGQQSGHDAGLLDLPEPAGTSPASAPRGARGTGGVGDEGFLAEGSSGRRREPLMPLSARVRGRTGFRAAALTGALAVVLGGSFWWQVATGTPAAVPLAEVSAPAVDEAPADGGDLPAEGADPAAGQGAITVHVAGAVAMPGVVQLPQGSRLHEAITAAGGGTAAADPDRLNLAAVLEDGQRILVPVRGDPALAEPAPGDSGPVAGSGPGASGPAEGRKIDLNTAGAEELGTLPRVGPVLAQRIVDWRRQHGRFKTVEELDAVDGIGPKLLEALLPLVRV